MSYKLSVVSQMRKLKLKVIKLLPQGTVSHVSVSRGLNTYFSNSGSILRLAETQEQFFCQ